jgi:hypothetical protein
MGLLALVFTSTFFLLNMTGGAQHGSCTAPLPGVG